MPIEQILKIEELIFKSAIKKFEIARHDLKILSACKNSEESLYSLVNFHGLDRGLTSKRLGIIEDKGFILRRCVGKKKVISLTEKAWEVIKYIEQIVLNEI